MKKNMRGEGRVADIGVWHRRPHRQRRSKSILVAAIAAVISALAFAALLLPSVSHARDSVPSSSPPVNNSYCLNVYCFSASGRILGFLGITIAVFTWDLSQPADYAYRYANTSIWFSDGQYHVSQQVESVDKTMSAGLCWEPDPVCENGYYEGLGLRTWLSDWAGRNFTLTLKENSGKELGSWDYHGQSVLYLGASSSTSGMNIAFDDWRLGLWSPSGSLYFEYPSWAGLAFSNASLDVLVMVPTYVDLPEFPISAPVCGAAVFIILLCRYSAVRRQEDDASISV